MRISNHNLLRIGIAALVIATTATVLVRGVGDDAAPLSQPQHGPTVVASTPKSQQAEQPIAPAAGAPAPATGAPNKQPARTAAATPLDQATWLQQAEQLQQAMLTAWMSGDAKAVDTARQRAEAEARRVAGAAPVAKR